MFDLNEAPNEVLAAISSEKAKRGFGMFFSVLCCLPTFGCSAGLCQSNSNADWEGCWPKKVSDTVNVTLAVLEGKLNELKFTNDQIKKANGNRLAVIEWQVRETIQLLEIVMEENIIQGSFRTTLRETLQSLKTKATQEEKYSNLLNKETSPLTGYDVYVPTYNMYKK